MLAQLSNAEILTIGLVTQLVCAIGVLIVARWRAFFAFMALVPLFWVVPFGLASGHCLVCLDGVVLLPLGFLIVLGVAKVRAIDRRKIEHRDERGGS